MGINNMTKAEKEAAKAVKIAEKEAAKAVSSASESVSDIYSIDGDGVKCDRVSVGSKADSMLQALALTPKVRTRIPREAKEPQGAFATVILNGLRINILKGVSVNLPQQVADVIDKSYYDTEKAINESKIVNPFTGKASNARVDMQSETDKEALNA